MTLTIELNPEIENRLKEEAAKRGMDVAEYLGLLVGEQPETQASGAVAAMPTNGAELVAYWQKKGLIGDWADRTDIGDSVEYAQALRRQLEQPYTR